MKTEKIKAEKFDARYGIARFYVGRHMVAWIDNSHAVWEVDGAE